MTVTAPFTVIIAVPMSVAGFGGKGSDKSSAGGKYGKQFGCREFHGSSPE
jgi:hypothetical protein